MVGQHVPGAHVLQHLASAHQWLGSQLQSTRDQQDQLERDVRNQTTQYGQRLLELARHYLPDLSRQSIENSFEEVRRDLQALADQQQHQEQQLRTQWEQALDQRATLEARLDEVTELLNETVAQRGELEQQLADRLDTHKQFHALSQRAVTAEQELARNEARVDDSREEASAKLPAYKNSRMFQYLVDRGYGTPDYRARGLTRQLDRWVARLVDFHQAKQSYDFLRTMPELMAAEVTRRRDEFEGLMVQIEEIERIVSDEIGLTTTLERGVQLGAERDALVGNLEAAQRERDHLEQQLADLHSTDSSYYSQAVVRVKRLLESLKLSALEAHAQQTADRQDDALVGEIRQLEAAIDQNRRQSANWQEELLAGQRKLADLASLMRQFRASEFDSRRSVFSAGFDPRPLVEAFLAGKSSKQALWQSLRSAQQFLPQWVEQRWPHPQVTLDNDFSYVMMRLLAEAAGAMIEHASQGQRGGGWSGTARRSPTRPAPRRRNQSARPPSVRRPARGGFTTGRGF